MHDEPEVTFAVRLTPRGGADRVDGVEAGVLRARVSAAPAEGAANAALLRLLAGALGVAPSALRIIRGARGRTKLVGAHDVAPERLAAVWPGLVV